MYFELGLTARAALSASSVAVSLLTGLVILLVAVIIAQTMLLLRGKLDRLTEGIIKLSVLTQAVFLVITLAVVTFDNRADLLVAVVGCLFSCVFAALQFKRVNITAIMKNCVFYGVTSFGVSLAIWTYTIANAHDSSWGTKGIADSISTKKGLIFRRNLLAFWLVVNAVVAAVVGKLQAENHFSMLYAYFFAGFLIIFSAIFYVFCKKITLKRKSRSL